MWGGHGDASGSIYLVRGTLLHRELELVTTLQHFIVRPFRWVGGRGTFVQTDEPTVATHVLIIGGVPESGVAQG